MTSSLQSASLSLQLARVMLRAAQSAFERAVAKHALCHAIRAVEAEMPNKPTGQMFFKRQIG